MTATTSPHFQPRARRPTISVIDVTGGGKIQRRGAAGGITRTDLLVIDKTVWHPWSARSRGDGEPTCAACAGNARLSWPTFGRGGAGRSDRVHCARGWTGCPGCLRPRMLAPFASGSQTERTAYDRPAGPHPDQAHLIMRARSCGRCTTAQWRTARQARRRLAAVAVADYVALEAEHVADQAAGSRPCRRLRDRRRGGCGVCPSERCRDP